MEKIRALIVDDDVDTANLFGNVLTLFGFECVIQNTARNALAYLAADVPDIILLDMRLGLELSGNDILYQIRSNPRLEHIRVIVITGYPQMAESISDLADLVMLKPVDVEGLGLIASRFTTVQPPSAMFEDPITHLYSLKFFQSRLELAFERMKRRTDFYFVLMMIAFQVHPPAGDPITEEEMNQLVKEIAGRLKQRFRPTDSFGRLDRERIIALFEDLKRPEDIPIILRRLRQQISVPYQIGQRTFEISIYTGAVLNDASYPSATALREATEQALVIARSRDETVSVHAVRFVYDNGVDCIGEAFPRNI